MKIRKLLPIIGNKSYIQKILSTQPLVYFPLNETSGITAVNYGTLGSSANGTYTGATLAQTPAPGGGLAPSFDGINDFVEILTTILNDNLNNSTGSMSIWAKTTLNEWTKADIRNMFSLGVDAQNINLIRKTGINATNYIHNAGGVSAAAYPEISPTDNWVNYFMTYDDVANKTRLYRNGVQIWADLNFAGTWAGTLTIARIGIYTTGGYWLGSLSNGALWNRVLSPGEISYIYRGGV